MLLWSLPALLFWAGVAAWAVETGGLPPSSPFIFLGLAIQLLQFAGMAQLAREERELKRRFHQGACLSCGYDLRATPGRCPECGALAAPTSPVAPGGKW